MLYLALPVLLGLALGHLAATALGIRLSPPVQPAGALLQVQPAPVRKPTLPDYQVIIERNIFDSTAKPSVALTPEEAPAAAPPPAARVELSLLGTVTRGDDSLAVIRAEQKVKSYLLGAEVPGGGTLSSVARHSVEIRYSDGSVVTLRLHPEEGEAPPAQRTTAAPAPAAPTRRGAAASTGAEAPSGQIREVGENRWVIPQQVAEQARGNLNELLRQARMEPNIVNGQTEGFVVRMIQPRSLLALLGIQRGDILRQINGVELDSPEKALQIFQQLREARNISIALQRGGNNLNFEYEIN